MKFSLLTEKQVESIQAGFFEVVEGLAYNPEEFDVKGFSPSAEEKCRKLIKEFIENSRKNYIDSYIANIPWNSDSSLGAYERLGSDIAHTFCGSGISFSDRAELTKAVRDALDSVGFELQDYTQPVLDDNGFIVFE